MASPFLDRIVSNRGLTKLFEMYCKSTYVSESWHFYKDVTDYRDIIEPEDRIQRAQQIFEKYLVVGAPEEVNIDQPKRNDVKVKLASGDQNLFAPLVLEILQTLENDAARKFFLSPMYKENKSKLSVLNAKALTEILDSPKERDLFQRYLKTIGESHQLEFYDMLIEFEKIENIKFENLKPKIEHIIENYIRENSPKQVQLPDVISVQIIEKLTSKNFDTKMFIAARDHIFSWIADTVAPAYQTQKDKGGETFALTLNNKGYNKKETKPLIDTLNSIKTYLQSLNTNIEGEILLKQGTNPTKEIWRRYWAKVEENALICYASDKFTSKKIQIDLADCTVDFSNCDFMKFSFAIIKNGSKDGENDYIISTKTYLEAKQWVSYLKRCIQTKVNKSTSQASSSSNNESDNESESSTTPLTEHPNSFPASFAYSQSKKREIPANSTGNSTANSVDNSISSSLSVIQLSHRGSFFFGLIESHNGENCSRFVEENIGKILGKKLTENPSGSTSSLLVQTMVDIDEKYLEKARVNGWSDGASGIFVHVRGDEITWCSYSDFQGIYCANGEKKIMTLSPPMKPMRVFGNFPLKEGATLNQITNLIASQPFVASFYHKKLPEFIILGNSYLWDQISQKAAVEYVRSCLLKQSLSEVTTSLVQYACQRGNPKGPVRAMIIQLGPILSASQLAKPELDDIWDDRILFMAYREYLYNIVSEENLCFYVAATHFERKVPEILLKSRAQLIFDTFISEKASSCNINLMADEKEKMREAIKSPHRTVFYPILPKIKNVLKREWWADFIASSCYAKYKEGGTFPQYPSDRAHGRNEIDLYDQIVGDIKNQTEKEISDSESALESSETTSEIEKKKVSKKKTQEKPATPKRVRRKDGTKQSDFSLDDLLGEIYAVNVQLKQVS